MMGDLKEMLDNGFTAHARAHQNSGATLEVTDSAVTHIRRRRRVRAVGATGAAALAVGAVAFGAMMVPGTAGPAPGDAAPAPTFPEGAPSWCDLDSHPPVNVEAMGEASYTGRLYADYDNDEFVWVAADGDKTVIDPDGDREEALDGAMAHYVNPTDDPPFATGFMMFDEFSGGGSGRRLDNGPGLGYEWTTVVPEDAPDEVDVRRLSEVHTASIGFGGTGLEPAVAGDDAIVESVVTWDDGTQHVERILRGGIGVSVQNHEGLESIATRVTLPSGETYAITSTYDATMTYAHACGVGPVEPPQGDDGPASAQDYHYGPYLEGPESAHFQCLAPLPTGLEAEDGVRVEARTGVQYDESIGMEVDYGDDGWMISWPVDEYRDSAEGSPPYPGWSAYWSDDTGETVGAVTYAAVVWVGADGAIVGRQSQPEPDESAVIHDDGSHSHLKMGSPVEDAAWHLGDVLADSVACDGIEQDALTDATPVVIIGEGRNAEEMEWRTITLE